jgi:selT/selW/selH-like putative selenoprotein
MPEVVIRFCVPCRYQSKAIQDADTILKEFGQELTAVRLIPGAQGVYDVELDGTRIFSLDRAMRFPESSELVSAIRRSLTREGGPPAR